MTLIKDDSKQPVVVFRIPDKVKRDIDRKNEARKHAGLSPIQIKVRTCVMCNAFFESAGNRTCGCASRDFTWEPET